MTDINYVVEGAHIGSDVASGLGSVFINIGTFKKIDINKKTVEDFEIIKERKYKDSKAYTISILFKNNEKSLLCVDRSLYESLLKIWPEKKSDRLRDLLQEGYSIVGFSSFNHASSGLGAGAISHNILLQKESNLEKVSFITIGDKQLDGHSHIFSSE